MRIKLYGRVIGIFLKKHSFINVLISLQLIAVFVIGIIMTSIIDEKASSYEAVKPLLNGEGLYCGGYFLKDNENGGLLENTDEIKTQLKDVDFISSVNFASLQTGVDTQTNEVKTAYALVYDDYSANLFRPTIEKGSWITDSKQSDDIPQAVITRNYQGYNVNDIAEFETENGTLKVRIIGVIGDNEKYLAANSEYESNEPSYQLMLSTHFNCLNDQLKNKGFTNEEIALKLESLGYSADSIVYNEPVLFFTDKEWNKTDLDSVMSDSLFIKYNRNISDDEKLYNRKYINENLSVLSFAIQFSQLNNNSQTIVYRELYTLMPIMCAIYLLVLIASVSVNAINCKNNIRNEAILYLGGAKRKQLLTINVIYNGLICIVSLIISIAGSLIFYKAGLFSKTVITLGWKQITICLIVCAVYILVSCIIPCIILTPKALKKAIILSEE